MSVRTQITHPLTGRRMSLTASSPGALKRIKREIAEIHDDVRIGSTSIAAALQRIEEKRIGKVAGADLLVRKCLEEWVSERPADVRIEKGTALSHFEEFEALPCVELTDKRLEGWAQRMREDGFAPGTIGAYFSILAAAVRRAVRRGELALVPWQHFRAPKAPKGPQRAAATSLDELRRIVAAARRIDERRRQSGFFSDLACRVVVMALTGLRNGEAAALGWDHIKLHAKGITLSLGVQSRDGWKKRWPEKLRPNFPRKGRSVLVQHLHPDAALALLEQRAYLLRWHRYHPEGAVFPSARTGRYRSQAVTIEPKEVRMLARLAGLPGYWVTHSLRHSFATLEANAPGGSARAAQQRIGHASLAQTDRYVHDATRTPPSAIERLGLATLEGALQDAEDREAPPSATHSADPQSNAAASEDEDPHGTLH